jgi:type I restriction enzyme S subunit
VEWLGEVPEHWELLPLFSVADERNESNRGMLEDNLLSLSYGRIIQKDIDSNDGLLPESFETYQIVHPDDIVFRLTDLQNDKRSLRTAIVDQRGIITSAYLALAPKKLQPQFINYLLRAYDVTKVFYSMGGGLRQSLKFSDVKRLPILVPHPREQCEIATFLSRETSKIDALVKEQLLLIELLKEKRQAVISHAVTKGLSPDAPMKDSGIEWIGEVPSHWTMVRLKFMAHVQGGVAKGRNLDGQNAIEVPYLRVANVQDGYLNLEEIATIEITANELQRYALSAGDVLMNEGGDFDKLGRGHIWRGEIPGCIHQNHVFAVRPKGMEPEWLNLVTSAECGRFYFMSRSKQSTNLASISSSNIQELPVPFPPMQERLLIIEHVRGITHGLDSLLAEANCAIDLLQEHRSALISSAVTGQIDVRNYRSQEVSAVCQ